jgi:hypothetical protein
MGKIRILESDLLDLLEDHSGSRSGYIDKQTGEIFEIFEDYDGSEQQETIDKVEEDPGRYLPIDPIESREGFRIMEDFVDGLPEGKDRDLLTKVLSWRKPFSNFRNALADMGDLRDQWFDFHNKELRRLAVEWLDVEEVDADLVPYGEARQQLGADGV